MLVLTRRAGESIHLGDDIIVTVSRINGNQVALGISAPQEMPVHRAEIYQRIKAGTDKQHNRAPMSPRDLADEWNGQFGPGTRVVYDNPLTGEQVESFTASRALVVRDRAYIWLDKLGQVELRRVRPARTLVEA